MTLTLTPVTPSSLTLTTIASPYAGFYPSATTYPSSTLYPGAFYADPPLVGASANTLTLTPA